MSAVLWALGWMLSFRGLRSIPGVPNYGSQAVAKPMTALAEPFISRGPPVSIMIIGYRPSSFAVEWPTGAWRPCSKDPGGEKGKVFNHEHVTCGLLAVHLCLPRGKHQQQVNDLRDWMIPRMGLLTPDANVQS